MQLDADIAALDLDAIAYKVCVDEDFDLTEVDRAIVNYRAFLQVIRNGTDGFVAFPTKEIDIIWHHHILDTQKYHVDCDRIFGRYLHHFPYSGIFDGDEVLRKEERRRETNLRLNAVMTTSNGDDDEHEFNE